ncbi:hypothetical protein KY329_00615 [Candidatus Woesearchaeota archaeon]|nr:hypothetical protein [Candidatus Woesearchaeota archaeon]
MRWLFLVLLVLVACAPVEKMEPQEAGDAPAVEEQSVPQPEVTLEKEESQPTDSSFAVVETPEIVCEGMVTADEFANICGLGSSEVSVTFRSGTKNCLVSLRHQTERTSYGGIELTRYNSAEKASSEFDRRLKVRMVGASNTDISDARTYEFAMIDLNNIEFLKNADIVNVKATESFCPKDKLMEFARLVAGKI